MFPTLGIGELLLVLALVLLLFGPGKLPQVAQSLGEAVNRFRNGTSKVADVKASDPKISEAPSSKEEPPTP
ncbi:MAG: twin-arginine translocase TatA/TatE family subunit [Vampirovibrionales bacterium]|jgi:sec-independent protein translocase protein TatA